MWNKENTRTVMRRFTEKYSREIFQEGSRVIEKIEEFFDEGNRELQYEELQH